MTATQRIGITLEVRNTNGARMGDEYSDALPEAISNTCARIRAASGAYATVTVPGFGIVTLLHDTTNDDNRHFAWLERFAADGAEGAAFVVGNVATLTGAIERAHS